MLFVLLVLLFTIRALPLGSLDMASNPRWWVVDQVIQKQPFFNNMAISVGNEQRIWSTTKGKTTFDTGMMIASSSKMVSSSMFFDAVEQGVLGYDDYVTE